MTNADPWPIVIFGDPSPSRAGQEPDLGSGIGKPPIDLRRIMSSVLAQKVFHQKVEHKK